ncbi:MAG: FAD-dependent oxidoreductase [Phototrophicaceae bacterium]
MKKQRIVIVGSSFAGYTAALELYDRLGNEHDIIVIDRKPNFLFMPSLIWYPFGLREESDISYDVRQSYIERNITFIQKEVTSFDLDAQEVYLKDETIIDYDYLVVATGPKADYDYIPGVREHSHSILGIPAAEETKAAWSDLLENPGPVVVVAAQGAACFGAAYEFLFNARYQARKHKDIKFTYVSSEPFASHFGIGGFSYGEPLTRLFFGAYDIQSRFNSELVAVREDSVLLGSGEVLPSKFTFVMPRFLGVDAVRNTPNLANEAGWIEVDDGYRHLAYPNVYAAGVAVHVAPPAPTEVACGVPKTGYPSEEMAKVVAHNIVTDIYGGSREELPYGDIKALCILDAGNMGMMIIGDKMLPDRKLAAIIPGPQAHWAKLGFEKYFMNMLKRSTKPKTAPNNMQQEPEKVPVL